LFHDTQILETIEEQNDQQDNPFSTEQKKQEINFRSDANILKDSSLAFSNNDFDKEAKLVEFD
jgi:hypothetical protein